MKRSAALVCVLIVFAFVLAGCETVDKSPGAGYGDPYPAPLNNPQITVLDPELRPWLGFQPATIVHLEGSPMQVQLPVRNTTERHYLIDYRILFYDAMGIEQEPAMGWTMMSMEPKQLVYLKANALDTRAVNYRVEVKWSK